MTSQREPRPGDAPPGGFSLIEVVTALAVVSITLVSLLGLFLGANERANELGRELAAKPSDSDARADASGESRSRSAWAWSDASVENALWREDGLHVRVRMPADPVELEVGWWVDGWLGGVRSVGDRTSGQVVLPGLRDVPAQAEVVVRLRTTGGPWGVPWRAGREGVGPLVDERYVAGDGGLGDYGDQPAIIVHGAAAGISTIRVAPPPADGPVGTHEWPAAVIANCGRVEVECDGRTQVLRTRAHGLFHLYY